MLVRKSAKRSAAAIPNPPALVAVQIHSEVHLCPRCWALVVRLVDTRSPEASVNCQCRHFHAFVASAATLAPRVKSPPALAAEEHETPVARSARRERTPRVA